MSEQNYSDGQFCLMYNQARDPLQSRPIAYRISGGNVQQNERLCQAWANFYGYKDTESYAGPCNENSRKGALAVTCWDHEPHV